MGTVVSLEGRLNVFRTPREVIGDQDRRAAQRKSTALRSYNARQRALRLQRTAAWADQKAIKAFYIEAETMTRTTGIVHEVDHIVPLLGTHVSGLHVETNLRVITRAENREKSNHFHVESGGS